MSNFTKKLAAVYLIILFFLSILFFYPGLFSGDTYFQYHEFNDHVYNDFQPVIMNIWWYIFRIKGAVFLVHLSFYYIGLWLIVRYIIDQSRYLMVLWVLIFFSNPLISLNILNVWKDIGMLSSIVLCVGILLNIDRYRKKLLFVILFLLVFYGLNVRLNGIFAFIPLIYYITFVYFKMFVPTTKIRGLKVFFVGTLLLLMMILLNQIITYKLFSAEHGYLPSITMRYDLSAIECMTKYQYQMPDIFFAEPNKVSREKIILCQKFSTEQSDSVFWWTPANNLQPFATTMTKDTFQLLQREWIVTIFKYFPIYLSFRGQVFWHSLKTNNWYLSDYSGNFPKIVDKLTIVFNWFNWLLNHYLGLIFLIFALTNMIIKIWRKQLFSISGIILMSSLMYEAFWFMLIPVADSRYFLWFYIGVTLSFIL